MSRKKKSAQATPLFEELLRALRSKAPKALNYKQISSLLGIVSQEERNMLQFLLQDLTQKEVLEEAERGKFRLRQGNTEAEGKLETTQSGSAYVIMGQDADDVFIPPRQLNGALHGDIVRVRIRPKRRERDKPEGQVISIVKRGREEFAGVLTIEKRVAYFSPDNSRFPDIIIELDKIGKAKSGEKVIARITDWEDVSDLPHGEVVAVLGKPGENETEINAIMVEFGLPYKFPKSVEQMAGLIATNITDEDRKGRRDLRDVTTFTIDPFDAKDFDDALSVRKLENDRWEIGVHIADVSHYLKPGNLLDEEALARATSVYLVDRVVPMLPEVLSNYACSLRPNEEKLTFSAIFQMDESGVVHHEWFGRTIIHSDRRFTYEEVQEILEGKDGDYKTELLLLDRIAKKLREERLRNGSITFEKEEVKFHLDENGNPTGVYFKVMKDSNQLIEDFMLLANKRVAEYCTLRKKIGEPEPKRQADLRRPFVYRVHASPDLSRVQEFATFVRTFGYQLNAGSEKSIAGSLNKLLKDVQGKPEANMIETLAIRTMAKAIYTTDNIGHYGLGFRYYTHFTSPIRRYPDVLAHRLLQLYLDQDAGVTKEQPMSVEQLEQLCKHCSEREKVAAEAERASIKYKQAQFLQDHVGEAFSGIISGVTEYGFFVELKDNKCEGMVHVRNLKDDRYVFDAERYRMRGLRNGKVYSLGDEVIVKVQGVDLQKKQIDFVIADGKREENNDDEFSYRKDSTMSWPEVRSSRSKKKSRGR